MNAMLKSTDRPISQTYRLALLDLDGVVYRGKNPVEHAADSIRAAQRAGMQVEYTTNNSSRFQRVVAEQLRGFGLDVEPRQVITSSVVAARMVARHVPAGARILVLGAEHLRPSYIVRDLRGLQEAQPSTDASDGNVWTCADATARLEDGSLTVSDATDINALRAACAAAWTYADNGGDIGSVSLPEFSL